MRDTAELLREFGHTVIERDIDLRARDMPVIVAIMMRGIRDIVREVDRPQRLERRTRAIARPGALIGDRTSIGCSRPSSGSRARIGRLWESFDVLLMPMMASPAAPAQVMEGRGAFATWQWESAGCRSACSGTRPASRRCRCPPGSPSTGCRWPCSSWARRTASPLCCRLRRRSKPRGHGYPTAPRFRLLAWRRRMAECRICSGELELLVRGNGAALTAAALSPSRTPSAATATCSPAASAARSSSRSCPSGDALHDLYREMRDDDYLDEEAGRRATANRLLDLIGAHVPRGRLLDVGCGHGLLLDEARTRGYETRRARALARGGAARARGARPRRPRVAAGGLRGGPQRRPPGTST